MDKFLKDMTKVMVALCGVSLIFAAAMIHGDPLVIGITGGVTVYCAVKY